ncbi:MAG: hypothetical protein U5K31_14835 [Balneolaceae bacterium]|nr:hypothetical protein [Balneolaceae bacterium]
MKATIRMRFLRLTGAAVLCLAVLAACGDNSTSAMDDDDGGGGGTPPPTEREPTWTNVSQILSTSCGGSSCHLSEPFESGVNLTSYSNVMNSVGEQYGKEIVEPGDGSQEASPIVDKINANPEFGDRMPLEGGTLSQDDIDLIVEWIDEGAQDN